ncbi:hypothetical protein ACYFX5_11935 [Bremerella sp. T1]|uniref:hypothetical protein n=1 Tax=Bremerella sp. TYQ1 TaxID=3119568 RepID=UPI001CCA36A6|nr:hypothetical protein [Bremerella volcania]UBM33782.1 hypothetical protein LA756_13880 [Bremerella volcania]
MLTNSRSAWRTSFGLLGVVLLASSFPAEIYAATELDRYLIAGKFRIFYTLKGESAVAPDDHDRSGVPDRVEDVARQLNVAYRLYCEVLQFPDPLTSSRFKEATCIQVTLLHRAKGNGVAYDAMSRARPMNGIRPDERVLAITIGSHVDPIHNVTPAHEMFHLIQYGATYFKNRWYLEGMTRWFEHGICHQALGDLRYDPAGPWPQSHGQQSKIFQQSYDAEYTLWNPIAAATDADTSLPKTSALRKLAAIRYSDGSPVMQDLNLQGASVMRSILIELGHLDDEAFQKLGYDRWSEKNQSSPGNNPFIYLGVMRALRQHGAVVAESSKESEHATTIP